MPLPRMRPPHVRSQAVGRRERLATRLADTWLLPRMSLHVSSKAAELGERLATCLADTRPLPRMRPHVNSQGAGRRERLAARLADTQPWSLALRPTSLAHKALLRLVPRLLIRTPIP